MTSIGRQYRTLRDGGPTVGGTMALLGAVVGHGKLPELASFLWWEFCYRMGVLKSVRFTPDVPATPSVHGWPEVALPTIGGSEASLSPSPEPWMLLYFDSQGDGFGCHYTAPTVLLRRSLDGRTTESARFRRPLVSIFVATNRSVYVCLDDGSIHRSDSDGHGFSQVLALSTEASFVRFDHGMVDTGGGLLAIAEYGNVHRNNGWQSVAKLYYSTDGGLRWQTSDFLIEQGVNKHSHLLRYSSRLDALILTVGDNKKQTWLASLADGRPPDGTIRWTLCNRRHMQTGGYTALAQTESTLFFGTDYHGGTNFIVESVDCRSFRKLALPDPYRRAPIYAMATRSSAQGTEMWATLHNAVHRDTRSLLMMSHDGGASWVRVLDYDGSRSRIRFASAGQDAPGTLYLHVTSVDDEDAERPLATLRIGSRPGRRAGPFDQT